MVSLKVSRSAAHAARERLALAAPLHVSAGEPRSLWLAPDHWLLVSDAASADDLIAACRETLAEILHNALDYTAALAPLRIGGECTRELLASGTGVDLRPTRFTAGSCLRTRLAQIPAIITAPGGDVFEVYVDRSHETHIVDWLEDSMEIAARAEAAEARRSVF